ncbi:MAG: hypothetical protein OXC40_03150 [Proteobacteria bacterium]|nr:hypothetical protein [Pseudomonadota bacterium]
MKFQERMDNTFIIYYGSYGDGRVFLLKTLNYCILATNLHRSSRRERTIGIPQWELSTTLKDISLRILTQGLLTLRKQRATIHHREKTLGGFLLREELRRAIGGIRTYDTEKHSLNILVTSCNW